MPDSTLTMPKMIASESVTGQTMSLRTQLRRAERMKKLKYGALIVPLVLFLLLTFVWPIAALLKRSVDNPEIITAFPATSQLLRHWDGKVLPDDPTFQ